jgi:hypothetical protein
MVTHTFVPNVRVVARLDPVVPMETIIAEPMLWSASIAFAREKGGPLTQAVLDALGPAMPEIEDGRFVNIDTESQDLMEGQYPSIPGWHCDGDGGPSGRISSDALVFACFQSSRPGGVSRTIYAAEPLTLEVEPDHVWPSVHRGVERFLMRREHANDGDVIRFDGNTLHRASDCYAGGWRFWFRLTVYQKPPQNVIKHRTQVYTPIESRG